MIPLALLPGSAQWGAHLEELLARPEALWIHGSPGTGVSTLAADLAGRRGVPWLDAESQEQGLAWLSAHPRGIVAAHPSSAPPPSPGIACLALSLPGLDEHPEALPGLLAHLALEEGLGGPLPPALAVLPCPGNLRELRNRVLRWKLLGQLPSLERAGPPRLEAEDLATNLHDLERFLLHRALRRAYGNRVEAARRLGVSRRQLYLLIGRHGDPVRGEPASGVLPRRILKRRPAQNSSLDPPAR